MTTSPRPFNIHWIPSDITTQAPFSLAHAPTPIDQPHWVGTNDALLQLLQWPEDFWQSSEHLAMLSGNDLRMGCSPSASVYSGHQFGVWAGQLGDGRALNLGSVMTPSGPQTIQLKGAGPTRYSRGGDGRAVLRSSIREFLASEAMWGLGIATTRALCVVGSKTPVQREVMETAAIVTRVAPGFLRFGHFEHFAHTHQQDALHPLITYLIEQHYPELATLAPAQRAAALFNAIGLRTARLMAQWQTVGFCHGVMNTDNMSVLGLTLDYGPFQWLDAFDVHHICNHSDRAGRYAYQRQPQIGYWNLSCLAAAFMPVLDSDQALQQGLENYKTEFVSTMNARFNAKLGLTDLQAGDQALHESLLHVLHHQRVDWTFFWRQLSVAVLESSTSSHAFDPVRSCFSEPAAFDDWLMRYQQRLDLVDRVDAGQRMLKTNPKFVLRNHLAELAIQAAQQGDFSMVAQLLTVLQNPFDEHASFESWSHPAPQWAASLEISCSS